VVGSDIDSRPPSGMPRRTIAERAMESRLVARLYESRLWRRSPLLALFLGISFAREQALILEASALEGHETVLDLACGSGIYTRPLARRLPAGRVIGLDRSPAMLARARRRARAAGLANAAFVRGDAGSLPFPSARFDRVNCCAALHLFADLDAALAEMRRVLRPGGVLTAAVLQRGNASRLAAPLRRVLGVATLTRPALGASLARAGFGPLTVLHATREWLLFRSAAAARES
jgi:SAM-dependent methyltransferase